MNEKYDEATARLMQAVRQHEPELSAGVDLQRAIRDGKRRVHRRRAAGAVVTAVVIVAAAVLPSVVGDQLRSNRFEPATPVPFDVRTKVFMVGTAGGFTAASYQTGRLRQRATLRPEKTGSPVAGTSATVSMWAPNAELHREDGTSWTPGGEPGPEIGGHRAYWGATVSKVELFWQWPGGGWGVVTLTGPGADRNRAYDVALSVIPAPEPIRVPFQLSGVDGLDVIAISTPYPGSAATASVKFGNTDDDPDAVTVTVQRPAAKVAPNVTAAGHPAVRANDRLTLLADLGQNVGARVEVSTVAALDRAGGEPGLGSLLNSVRVAGDPNQQNTWPTEPVR